MSLVREGDGLLPIVYCNLFCHEADGELSQRRCQRRAGLQEGATGVCDTEQGSPAGTDEECAVSCAAALKPVPPRSEGAELEGENKRGGGVTLSHLRGRWGWGSSAVMLLYCTLHLLGLSLANICVCTVHT
jgi:hypothetical protein